ncbi:hypothetical protein EMCRGX_G019278 [Ephydatia muelleri]
MGNAQSQVTVSSEENQHGQSCYSACFSRMLAGQMEKNKALKQQALSERDGDAKPDAREPSMNEDTVAAEKKSPLTKNISNVTLKGSNTANMISTMGTSVEYEDAEIYFCAPTNAGVQNKDENSNSIFPKTGSCTQSSASEEPVMYAQLSTRQSRNAHDVELHDVHSAFRSQSSTSPLSRNGSSLPDSISALRSALDSTSGFLSNNFGQQTSTCNQETSTSDRQVNTSEHCTHQPESIMALRTYLESTSDSQNSTPEPQTDATPLDNNSHLLINLSNPPDTVSALCAFLNSISGHDDSETELNEDHQYVGNDNTASPLPAEDPVCISSSRWQYQTTQSCVSIPDYSSVGTDDDYSECDEFAGPSTEQDEGEDPENPLDTSMNETFVDNTSLQCNRQGSSPSRKSVVIMITDYEKNIVQSFCTLPLTPLTPIPLSTPPKFCTPPHDPCIQVDLSSNDSDCREHSAESYGTTTNREVSDEQEDEEAPDEQQVDNEIYFVTGSDMTNSGTMTPVDDSDDDYEDLHSDTDNGISDSALGGSVTCGQLLGTDQLQQDGYIMDGAGPIYSQISETRTRTCDDLQNESHEPSQMHWISQQITFSTEPPGSTCKDVLPPTKTNASSSYMESQPSASQPDHPLVSPTA